MLLIVSSAELLNQFTCNPHKTKMEYPHTYFLLHLAEEQETAYMQTMQNTHHAEHSQQFLYIMLKTLN